MLNPKKLPVRGEYKVAYGTGEFEVLLDLYGARVHDNEELQPPFVDRQNRVGWPNFTDNFILTLQYIVY